MCNTRLYLQVIRSFSPLLFYFRNTSKRIILRKIEVGVDGPAPFSPMPPIVLFTQMFCNFMGIVVLVNATVLVSWTFLVMCRNARQGSADWCCINEGDLEAGN